MEENTRKHPRVRIPASLVPRAPVDYDAEARQILGFPLDLPGDLSLPPLTAGALIAWELVSSPFFLYPDTCEAADAARAVILASSEPDQVRRLTQDPAELTALAAMWLADHGAVLADHYRQVVAWYLHVPFYGFSMRPGGEQSPREFWFDGSFCGGLLAPACRMLGISFDRVLWRTPLCLVGHAVAQHDASLGVKGIERPPDLTALDRMMAEAEARELRGELHPWQYVDPYNYPLTATQAEANPDLIGKWQDILANWEKHHGRVPWPESPDQEETIKNNHVNSRGEAEQFTSAVEAKLHGG